MVILWLAGGLIVFWIVLWMASVSVMRRHGGEILVDNDRDINSRHFAKVLHHLLKQALLPTWGQAAGIAWRTGELPMHRGTAKVTVHNGDVRLGAQLPRALRTNPVALVVTGNLVVDDYVHLPFDIWCLGDATIGSGCGLRALAAEGSVSLGEQTRVERWVDARKALRMGAGVTVVAAASAGEELILGDHFTGGKVSAPLIRTSLNGQDAGPDRAAVAAKLAHWTGIRQSREWVGTAERRQEDPEWMQPQSVTLTGDFWAGPGTVLLHDLVARGGAQIGDDCIVVGSIHTTKDLHIGRRSLVTGDVACADLVLERDAVVAGSVHADGHAVLRDGAIVGLTPAGGGLAATGEVHLEGPAEISLRIFGGDAVIT